MRFVAFALVTGCSFSASLNPSDPTIDAPADDAMRDAPPDVAMMGVDFLPMSEETFGSTNWSIAADTAIDTSLLSIVPAPPAGVTFLAGVQDNGAPVAILRVGDFTIGSGRRMTVTGERPFAILSDHDVTITGTLDVGARLAQRGPGGALPAMGSGAGLVGVHDDGTGSDYDDAGGGGGSFGTRGAAGGKAGPFNGGASGQTYPLNGLVGGSGGGRAGVCANMPGAGGGALLLYAANKVRITGAITAGGGGGAGGLESGCATGAGSGAGGGSGGTIWIQTTDLDGTGVLAANGGGGGGGSYIGVSNGGPGENGQPSTTDVANGGTKANSSEASVGGNGAIQGTAASMVPNLAAGNGGGGGGGLGRIVYHAPSLGALQSSPTAVVP